MKKVFFSAIALLAFTATSFAAEGKKEVKKTEAKIVAQKSTKLAKTVECPRHNVCIYAGWSAALDAVLTGVYSDDFIDFLRDSAEESCEDAIRGFRDGLRQSSGSK